MGAESSVAVVGRSAEVTSHQVVGCLHRLLGTRRTGHAGTLDPVATGVLILGVNQATRLLGHLALHDERYLATVCLGQGSATDDANSEVVTMADAPGIIPGDLEPVLAPLCGRIQQVPSAVSVIKVDGRRVYDLTGRGMEVELKAREMEVTHLDALAFHPGEGVLDMDINVECSSGTYMCAIARDLGKSPGISGHLTALRCARIGSYDLPVAVKLGKDPPMMMSMAGAAKRSFSCATADLGRAADAGFGRHPNMAVPVDVAEVFPLVGEPPILYCPGGDGAKLVAVLV